MAVPGSFDELPEADYSMYGTRPHEEKEAYLGGDDEYTHSEEDLGLYSESPIDLWCLRCGTSFGTPPENEGDDAPPARPDRAPLGSMWTMPCVSRL